MGSKYIFVVGGVMSGVGKGIASASIGKILQSRGLNVTSIKIDPYVNVDAGTMNPTEHGEVFVLDDGTECDQDMGNYERFLDCNFTSANYMTTGSVYLSVIQKERNLEYGGRNVEVVPHIPLEVIEKINRAVKKSKADVVIIEIGGTVGEYQNILFLEAVRFLKLEKPQDVALVLVSFLPQQGSESEMKTKPTQYAVRTLNSSGLQPDLILARAPIAIDEKRKEKIALNCNMQSQDVISAPDVKSIYEVPVNFDDGGLTDRLMKKLNLRPRSKDLREWHGMVKTIRSKKPPVKIAIVGKYFGSGNFILADSYISVIEAVKHAAYLLKREPLIEWLDAESFEKANRKAALKELSKYDGVIVPGGFGRRGVEGKIAAIKYLRENQIPFFGLCYGMQLATIEFARNVVGLKGAQTTEIDPNSKYPVIDIMPEQKKNLAEKNYGATMRLGAYPAQIKTGTIAFEAYKDSSNNFLKKKSSKGLVISERHRHRYEVNPDYIEAIEKKGLAFSGTSPDRRLMEIAELPKKLHPFFLGAQFHPELKSRPLSGHPLFVAFVKAAISRKK
jgi:CTP synthase